MIRTVELRPGYRIPRIIKGGWQLAGGHGPIEREKAIAGMAAFCDAGLDTFDCADIYTGVESLIGEFVATGGKPKIHTKLVPDLDRLDRFNALDVEAIVDRSRQRLRVDCLDLLQFFWWDMVRGDPVGVMGALIDLQAKGKIRHLGTTNFDQLDQARFLNAGLELVSAQVQYSLLDRRAEGEFVGWCQRHDVHLLCYGVLAGGFFSEAWLGQPDPGYAFKNRSLIKYRLIIDEFGGWSLFQALLAVLATIAKRHGSTIPAVAVRWVLDRPQVAAAIVGARTAEHLQRTLAIFDLELDGDDRSAIADVLDRSAGPAGPVYGLERDRSGRHGRIMKYNLGAP